MKKFNVSILAASALVLGLAVAGCTPGKDSAFSADNPVAKIGNVTITQEQMYDKLKKDAGKRVMADIITLELYKQEGDARGITVTDQELDARVNPVKEKLGSPERFQQYLKDKQMTEQELREGVRAVMLRDKLFEKDNPITEEQIKEYYEKNKDKFEGTFEEARPKVIEKVKSRNKRNNMDKWIEELYKKHNVQIMDKDLESEKQVGEEEETTPSSK
ncbi:peptidyl-prolyl cis-trans isomerase [Brevibacillus sp. HB1.3]|uniref:SurA N-terminal domain-containing protein n=1 Tax=Brevibacillus sp. HB1.3 TaxID=2738842 RepID=UPI0020A66412|nr:SurA N-terminal domain-containing protein [Brevibacillus sp. HB1.3]NQF12371.1 peptidyl-prolyl cis-trans isomerase [Brevibacillus sp. HB1.3]